MLVLLCSKFVIISLSGPAYAIGIIDTATGNTVTLKCLAGGIPSNFTYQWMKNGVTINGETNVTLMIHSVSTSDIGVYKCTPSNSLGSTNSSSIIFSVTGKDVATTFLYLSSLYLSTSGYKWITTTNNFWTNTPSS